MTELTVLNLVFPDQLDKLGLMIEPESTSNAPIRIQTVASHFSSGWAVPHEFSKATILKLSDDLGHIWSSSVREKLHSDCADCLAHVLVLTVGRAAGYIESGQK
ncbi:hypothetical protein F2Q69_00059872 [Brassica cretica]|uniref:Uncharacterized protein n=1 Tax=Brassica cretica TaxID=69181 RepID=A0A8S9RNV8_BRACR|nr:hypothetical protein F2Q69_00059872 [Brassica cretica]